MNAQEQMCKAEFHCAGFCQFTANRTGVLFNPNCTIQY